MIAVGCDGDRCDVDEHCLSGTCDYGECGSTLVSIIEHAIEEETAEDDDFSYDEDTLEELEPSEPPRECSARSCFNLNEDDCARSGCDLFVFGCGEAADLECALADLRTCTPECPTRFVCGGEPTLCDDLDRVSCLAERACRVPGPGDFNF